MDGQVGRREALRERTIVATHPRGAQPGVLRAAHVRVRGVAHVQHLVRLARGALAEREEDRAVTEAWLRDVAGVDGMYAKLYMRPAKDYRSDDIIKGEILDQMHEDGYDPTMAVDDRDQVVAMFRARGLRVLQVAPGDF